jgi:hypothetical protein
MSHRNRFALELLGVSQRERCRLLLLVRRSTGIGLLCRLKSGRSGSLHTTGRVKRGNTANADVTPV